MTSSIKDIFRSRTKEQIEVIMDYFKMPLKKSARKEDLLCELSEYLHGDPSVWLRGLLEPDLKLLRVLCSAGPGETVAVLKPDFPTIIEVLQFVKSDEVDEKYVSLSLEPAMFEIVNPAIDKVIAEKEADGSFEIERLVLGCLNIYGVLPLRTFVDSMFEGVSSEDKAMDLTSRISKCPLIRIYQEDYHGEFYIASPFVDNFSEILEMRKMTFKNLKKYAKMDRNSAIAAGTDSPFCYYGRNTEEGKTLEAMLSSIGYEGEELRKALHTVWMSSQYAIDEDATEILFSPVTDKQDDIPSFEMYRDCIDTIVNYSNSIPKWLLKGQSSNKTGKMKLSIRVDDLSESYGVQSPYLQLFDMGFAVQPVPPDDPCPCGSGFAYRNCHGKHFS